MSISRLLATAVATLVLVGTQVQFAGAQGAAPRPSGHNIAVVDVSVIFKEHIRFKTAMDGFKKEVQDIEGGYKKEFDALNAMAKQLADMKPGTPDYKNMETRIATGRAKMQLDTAMKKKEFLEKEGAIYFRVYTELDTVVSGFARAQNIALVLRYASDPVDNPTDRAEILRGINKPIVYVDPSLDITQHIVKLLNRPTGNVAPGPAPGPAFQGVVRPGTTTTK